MLQQTQIATALPFYQSFLDRFPTLAHLAGASESDVLRAWSGLGYYRRARHLHEAARTVMREHGGAIPADEITFGTLPGVGRYTRGAVLSIAFGTPLPVLDGNVARVLARWFARPWSVRDPRAARSLWELASVLVPRRGAGDWNQALMDLGATVCTPRNPRCEACPVRTTCAARAAGTVERYPPTPRRAATVKVSRAVAVLECRGRWLLGQRSGAVLEGMWEPPGVEIGRASPRAALRAELRRLGVTTTLHPTTHRVKHRITHHEIDVEVWRGEVGARAKPAPPLRWVDALAPDVPLTGLTRRLARLLAGGQRRAG